MLSHLIQWFVRVIITPQPAMSKLVLPDVAGVVSSCAQTQMWLFTPELCIQSHHAAASEMEAVHSVPGTAPSSTFTGKPSPRGLLVNLSPPISEAQALATAANH